MHHQFYFSNLVNRLLCCLFHNFICCCYYYYYWFTIQQICSVPYSIYVVIFAAWLFQQLWNCYYCRAYFFKFQLHVYTGVGYLDHVWLEVERWWKLYDLSVKSFLNVIRFWCWGLGVLTVLVWGGILWGVSSDDGGCWISFLQCSFSWRNLCFRWWRVFWWVLSPGGFLGCSAYLRCLCFFFSLHEVGVSYSTSTRIIFVVSKKVSILV